MLQGEIIFLKNTFGFIKSNDGTQYFFLKKNIDIEGSISKEVGLFDSVTFETFAIKEGKHKGKTNATNIKITAHNDISIHKYFHPTIIGTITKRRWGYLFVIKSPELEKDTFLYASRIVNGSTFSVGDLCVFHPVKSIKPEPFFFAYFAYKLEKETDPEFLISQYTKRNSDEILKQLQKLKIELDDLQGENRLIYDLVKIAPIDSTSKYVTLKNILLKEGKGISLKQLKQFVNEKYQLLLWEEDIIPDYDLQLMKERFHIAKANEKRYLISKINSKDVVEILKFHIDNLEHENKFSRINNYIKTILDIIYRNQETANEEVYHYILPFLARLVNKEKYELWLNGYIDEIESSILESELDLNRPYALEKALEKIGNSHKSYLKIQNHYETKILKFAEEKELGFNEQLDFVKHYFLFQSLFHDRYSELLESFGKIFNQDQVFIIKVFNLDEEAFVPFDLLGYIDQNREKLNSYYLVRLGIERKIPNNYLNSIDEVSLKSFISRYDWESIIYPTSKEYINQVTVSHFMDDIINYNAQYSSSRTIEIIELAKAIYNQIPKYKVEHLRLWIEYLSDEKDYFEYTSFKPYYKLLENQEQKQFKILSDKHEKEEVEITIRSKIKPCENIIESDGKYICIASVTNIYFSSNHFELYVLINDKLLKVKGDLPGSSIGLNALPAYGEFVKIPLKITLDNNKAVTQIEGFKYLFTLIIERNIEEVLGKIGTNKVLTAKYSGKSYAEDWQLKEQIIAYLKENSNRTVIVGEPKNHFRKLDDKSGIDNYEKIALYVFEDENINIIWENIDYSEDRATYIFKCAKENLEVQLNKLTNAIATMSQLRSTLKRRVKADDTNLQIFKDNFGYIANIRKQRGKSYPFYNWESKIKLAFKKPIPKMPTPEEYKSALSEVFVYHPPRPLQHGQPKSKPKPIIPKLDGVVPEDGSGLSSNDPHIYRETLLSNLKELNELISQFLK